MVLASSTVSGVELSSNACPTYSEAKQTEMSPFGVGERFIAGVMQGERVAPAQKT